MTPRTVGGAVAVAEWLEALARKPLQPRRALLRQLARRFRAIEAAERAQYERRYELGTQAIKDPAILGI